MYQVKLSMACTEAPQSSLECRLLSLRQYSSLAIAYRFLASNSFGKAQGQKNLS